MQNQIAADIATLRDSLDFFVSVIRSGEAFTETVMAQDIDASSALARVEAEIARLTARRSRYAEARYENCMEALSATEARCARLQQALRDTRERTAPDGQPCWCPDWKVDDWRVDDWRDPELQAALHHECCLAAREALAGTDTLAGEYHAEGLDERGIYGGKAYDTPADSPKCPNTYCESDGWVTCTNGDGSKFRVPCRHPEHPSADSQEDKT